MGGTGSGAVLKLKKRFIDAYGSVPPILRFLTIDTTENVEYSEKANDGTVVTLEPNERFVLQVMNPGGLVNGTNEHIDEWWPANIPVAAITAGAGQVRARGRLALFAKSRDIFGRIRGAIDDVMNIKNKKQMYAEQFEVSGRGGVEIYIVGSLAGGTGGGLALDVAFISRKYLDALSNITGVLVLLRLFSALAGTHLVKSNAYGALKEIEQFSKLKSSDAFEIDYGSDRVEVKEPPFDLLYLIDSINEAGQVVTDSGDLLSLIADGLYVQIGSQIGADSDNTVDNIKSQLATAGLVRGRSASYCSFGVASLTLPVREYEAMQFEDARKLVSDGLLNGLFPDSDIESAVVSFIQEQRLREDEADDVINALSERDGGGQMRFPMPLGSIKFDRNALSNIKNLHVTQRSRFEQQIAQQLEINYKHLQERATAAIDRWWEWAINRANGLTYAFRFGEKLISKLEWYQHKMEAEAKEEGEKLKALNFKPLEEALREAATSWIGLERRVRNSCDNYKGVVDRETDLLLQIARRDKAAELYGMLRLRMKDILDRCTRIRIGLEGALKSTERLYLDASMTRGSYSLFEQALNFDLEADRPKIIAEHFVDWHNRTIGTLAAWADRRAPDVVNAIMNYIREQYRPLTEMPIDDVLRRSSPDEVGRNLTRMANLAVPLWRYDESKIPVVNRKIISELYHYGVADASRTILQDSKYFPKVPHGATIPSIVSTLNLQRVILFKVKVGVPLFALHDIEEMELAYNDPDKVVSNHLHKEWERFPNLIPRTGDGEALRWFALAQAPTPFALIFRRGEWYYVRSVQAKKTDRGELRLAQGRLKAFYEFEKNRDLVKEIEEIIEGIVRTQGEAKVSLSLRNYSEELASQASSGRIDATVKEQVEGEVHAIEEYLQRLATIR
jgi:hypothetical protein